MSICKAKLKEAGFHPQKLIEMFDAFEKQVELHSISIRYDGDVVIEGAWTPQASV